VSECECSFLVSVNAALEGVLCLDVNAFVCVGSKCGRWTRSMC